MYGLFYRARGFTLVESLVGAGVFLLVAVSAYEAYAATMNAARISRLKITATALVNEQFEIARNLPYADVGIAGGFPSGKIPPSQTLLRDTAEFLATTTVRNIDDPFDGTIGGTPNDTSPADMKLVEMTISCPSCKNFIPLTFTTHIAPKALESASGNGALFVQVFDAVGQAVPQALVHIENNAVAPPFVIDDMTNNNGLLQIIDAPPGAESYEVTVSKSGYSSERTYQTGAPSNPNPTKPHATVVAGVVTQISFAIDRTSTLAISSVRDTCAAAGSVDFGLEGGKMIGTAPDILKYSAAHVTDAAGLVTLSGLEWDTYAASATDATYDLAGSIPLLPVTVNPNMTQDLKLIVAPKNPQSILITVKDAATGLPLSDASVRLEKIGYDETAATGRGFLRQTDWSGAGGQADFIDPTKYFSSDGNSEVNNPPGELKLKQVFGEYAADSFLTSSTFDTGSVSNFHQILWEPENQPPETGPDAVRFHVATNNDNATWDFKGPDGTAGSYYTSSNHEIHSMHDNDRYFRYKVFLNTASTTWTPTVSDISFTFTSSCVPPGQAFFTALGDGNYTATISKIGYQTVVDTVTIANPWQTREFTLSP